MATAAVADVTPVTLRKAYYTVREEGEDVIDLSVGQPDFETPAHERAVLVYNPGGFWEPPGGVVEADQMPPPPWSAVASSDVSLPPTVNQLPRPFSQFSGLTWVVPFLISARSSTNTPTLAEEME